MWQQVPRLPGLCSGTRSHRAPWCTSVLAVLPAARWAAFAAGTPEVRWSGLLQSSQVGACGALLIPAWNSLVEVTRALHLHRDAPSPDITCTHSHTKPLILDVLWVKPGPQAQVTLRDGKGSARNPGFLREPRWTGPVLTSGWRFGWIPCWAGSCSWDCPLASVPWEVSLTSHIILAKPLHSPAAGREPPVWAHSYIWPSAPYHERSGNPEIAGSGLCGIRQHIVSSAGPVQKVFAESRCFAGNVCLSVYHSLCLSAHSSLCPGSPPLPDF